jgi:hypothetical protein
MSLTRATALLLLAMACSTGGAAPKCALEQIDEWPIRLVRSRLIVEGTANGQRIAVLLGTGAQQSVMLRSAAERLRLSHPSVKGFPLIGLGGESRAEEVTVNRLEVGRYVFNAWQFQIPIDHKLGDDFDVVLGEDFFSTVDVEFDLAHNAVRLFKPSGDCDGVSLAYWAPGGASEVEMERVLHIRPQINLPVRVNGQPAQALLDTGTTASVLTRRGAREAGLTPESPGVVASAKLVGIGEKSVDVWVGPLKSFTVADETISDFTIRFADLYKHVSYIFTGSHTPYKVYPEPSILLGVDFLSAHRVLVAHSQRKIYLTSAPGTSFGAGDAVPASSAWVSGAGFALDR